MLTKNLVDGIAVSGDIGGSTAVFQIPVEDIERIEIIQEQILKDACQSSFIFTP